ncbi:ATP-binding protein [Thermaerobacter composti]|uniref:ATP-binding protein n=1 Tax=Thermaerobacter composti TaxID=554949 RepID=UPI0039A12E0E
MWGARPSFNRGTTSSFKSAGSGPPKGGNSSWGYGKSWNRGGVDPANPRFTATFRKPSGVSTARRRMRNILEQDGCDPALIQRVILAASEAMNNAVRYAGRGRLCLFTTSRRLRVVVTDNGPGIAFEKLARTLLEPRDQKTIGRGHGYWLMVSLSSQCRVFSGSWGTRVELVFDGCSGGG